MISEFLLNIVFNIVEGVFSILPNFQWSVENSFFSTALDMVRLACYVLPMETISAIIILINFLLLFRIIVSILRTIWDILPLV